MSRSDRLHSSHFQAGAEFETLTYKLRIPTSESGLRRVYIDYRDGYRCTSSNDRSNERNIEPSQGSEQRNKFSRSCSKFFL